MKYSKEQLILNSIESSLQFQINSIIFLIWKSLIVFCLCIFTLVSLDNATWWVYFLLTISLCYSMVNIISNTIYLGPNIRGILNLKNKKDNIGLIMIKKAEYAVEIVIPNNNKLKNNLKIRFYLSLFCLVVAVLISCLK